MAFLLNNAILILILFSRIFFSTLNNEYQILINRIFLFIFVCYVNEYSHSYTSIDMSTKHI